MNVVNHAGWSRPVRRREMLAGAATLAVTLAACGEDRGTEPAAAPEKRDVDVAVIGAGIAGLAAARTVARSGRSCVVLEARDRVGGRIWTSEEWPGLPVDLGASWIHGTDGNPVYREATLLGLRTAPFDVGSFEGTGSAAYYTPEGAELDSDAVEKRNADVVGYLEGIAGRRGAGATSLRAAVDALPAALREVARTPDVAAGMNTYAGDFGAAPGDLALSALDEDDSFPGVQRVFPGGYGQLARQLADGLPVRLNTPVSAVSLRDPDRIAIDTADGRWRAAAVIVTVPLGVLKRGAVRFDPPLPAAHRRAIDAIGFGRFEKLVLRFDTAFWDDAEQIQVIGRPGQPFTGWYNLERVAGAPALMALNGGDAAAATAGMGLDRQTAVAGEVLAGVYRDRFRPPVAAQASAWWDDEFSRGSYSFTAVGSGDVDREAMAEPVDDRLWLAGEAVHEDFHSTVHGAWLSGQAAAEQATA